MNIQMILFLSNAFNNKSNESYGTYVTINDQNLLTGRWRDSRLLE